MDRGLAVCGELQWLSSLKETLFHPSLALQSSTSGPSAGGAHWMMRSVVPRASIKPAPPTSTNNLDS